MRRVTIAVAFIALAALLVTGGVARAQSAPPRITELSPLGVAMGDPPPALTIIGQHFADNSVVRWNGSPRVTHFVSDTRLTAELTTADVASPGVAMITVSGPGTSNAVPFSVSPLKATLIFPPTAPVDATYPLAPTCSVQNPTACQPPPLTIFLHIQNVSGAPIITTAGFTDNPDLVRRLYFTEPNGGIVTNQAQELKHARHYHCFSRNQVIQRPTAIPVVLGEVLPADFFREYKLTDARLLYKLVQSGPYGVHARIPLATFVANDPSAIITDCDQFPGVAVLNVSGVSGSHSFTVVSNTLAFTAGSLYRFAGFAAPLTNDSACATPPCRTYNRNSTIPLKFQLFDANNAVVSTAVARIAVQQLSGTPPAQTPTDLGTGAGDSGNRFRFDGSQYVFNLNAKILAVGVWRVDAVLDDGTVHSVHIGLR